VCCRHSTMSPTRLPTVARATSDPRVGPGRAPGAPKPWAAEASFASTARSPNAGTCLVMDPQAFVDRLGVSPTVAPPSRSTTATRQTLVVAPDRPAHAPLGQLPAHAHSKPVRPSGKGHQPPAEPSRAPEPRRRRPRARLRKEIPIAHYARGVVSRRRRFSPAHFPVDCLRRSTP
jgi:hypothetical protein